MHIFRHTPQCCFSRQTPFVTYQLILEGPPDSVQQIFRDGDASAKHSELVLAADGLEREPAVLWRERAGQEGGDVCP